MLHGWSMLPACAGSPGLGPLLAVTLLACGGGTGASSNATSTAAAATMPTASAGPSTVAAQPPGSTRTGPSAEGSGSAGSVPAEGTVSPADTRPGGGPVTVAGHAFLRLGLLTQAEPGVQTTSSVTGSGAVAQARTTGFLEGYAEVLIGLRGGQRPLRALALTDPGRIVLDVRRG